MSLNLPSQKTFTAQLQDTSVESLLQGIDHGLVYLPSYRELYYRWERQHWSAQELDFIEDRIQWEELSIEEQNEQISAMATFYQGEVSVTDALGPYIIAAPDEEMRIFLTTQLVDEARHAVFFNRFFTDVLEIDYGRVEDTLAHTQQYMNQSARFILIDSLLSMGNCLRTEPANLPLLIEGVVLYHMIVEGMMGLAGQKTLLEQYRKENLFPTFRLGMTGVTRDESRHVLFGVRFLRDMVQQDPAHQDVIEAALHKYAPEALKSLILPEEVASVWLARGDDPWKTPRYAQESLRKKLKVIGLGDMGLPFDPVPSAV